MTSRIRRWQNQVGDTGSLGIIRIAIGVMLFIKALDEARDFQARGYFGDFFHMPFVPEAWVPSRSVYLATIAVRLLLAALITAGHRARPALLSSAIIGMHILLCDRLSYHHNRYTLLCFAFLLAFTPCDRTATIEGVRPPRTGPLWAAGLARLQVAIIYLASSGSKLLDHDWQSGRVLLDRFVRYGGEALDRGVPPRVVELFTQGTVTSALAKIAIGTELFLAFALFNPRTRIFALWWGVMFHLTIEVTSKVELFTWLTLTTYAFFVTPDRHARKLFFDPSRPRGVLLARAVSLGDWFSRFEIRGWEPDRLRNGHTLVVVRRDGSRATGIRALATIARCVPLLFPLWAPLALVASLTRGGEK